jgi:hypothetical protein
VAEVQGQFGNAEEGKHPPLETVTRGLVKTQLTEKISAHHSELYTL